MFQYDRNTVCKLLALPELDFYQSIPDTLKNFTPEFRGKIFYSFLIYFSNSLLFYILGIITVQYCEDELGYIKLVARPQTTSLENKTTSNDQDLSSTNDSQISDSVLQKSVQFVSIKFFYFQIKYI